MNVSGHLSRELLDGFFLGRVTSLELLGEAVGHLEETCPGCRRRLEPGAAGYRRALQKASRRLLANAAQIEAERAALPALLAELATLRGSEMLVAVAGERRFHTTAFTQYQLGLGWAAVEADELPAAREAVELGYLSSVRLDRGRYGRIAAARLETESFLLRACLALARSDREEVDLALEAAGGLVPGCHSDDLEAGFLLARASVHLWQGEAPSARRLLAEASRLTARGRTERWTPSIETALARIDRRAGRPELAAERLRKLFRDALDRPRDLAAWGAARELVAALVDERDAQEAAAFVTSWRSTERQPPGERPADLAHCEGQVLAALGRHLAARRRFWTAWALYRIHGRVLDVAAVLVDLARLGIESKPAGEPLASPETLLQAIEELVAQESMAGEALVAFARFARALSRGTLGERELAEIEEGFLRLRPLWGVAGHGSP